MKRGRGRPQNKQPLEGDRRKSMKKLTENYEEFMKGRNSDRQDENENGKEEFETVLKKAVSKRKKA